MFSASSSPARACGLDFGTSNSTVGHIAPGRPDLLALEAFHTSLPSAVFFNVDEDSVHYGRDAMSRYLEGYEGRLVRALKSLLGTALLDSHTEIGGRALSFRHLLEVFIGELKRRAEHSAGREFEYAVFGRPVYFVDGKPDADLLAEETLGQIARKTGFREVSFQYEPIGAALHYERTLDREELVLVADIGGGTADFSLLRLSPERSRRAERKDDLLANGGVHIGGTDFDRALNLAVAMPLFGLGTRSRTGAELPSRLFFQLATWHTIPMAYTRAAWADLQQLYRMSADHESLERLSRLMDRQAGHWLASRVEEVKIVLSDADHAQLDLDDLCPGLSCPVDSATFADATQGLVERIGQTVTEVLTGAGVAPDDVDTLFFAGGGSGVGPLRTHIASLVSGARIQQGDLFGSIGAGLAVEAARRYG